MTTPGSDPALPVAATLFVLSFRHRDELAGMVARQGWHPIAARRSAGAELRFIGSGARLLVVDGRGAFYDGLEATRTMSDTVEANGAAMLVLVSRNDIDKLDDLLHAGATHYLASPFGEEELHQALRFAERYVQRLAGTDLGGANRAQAAAEGQLRWQVSLADGKFSLSAAAARLLGLASREVEAADILARFGKGDRLKALAAFRHVRRHRLPTAFVHTLPGQDAVRFVQHLRYDPAREAVEGSMEQMDMLPVSPRSRELDPLTGLASGNEARAWIAAPHADDGKGKDLLLLLSLQRFESVNTIHGRATGDAILKAIGRRIEPIVRETQSKDALIARMAGAEFAIGLTDVSEERADIIARALLDACQRPFLLEGGTLALQPALGGVMLSGNRESDAVILRRVSAALAEARGSGESAIRILSVAEADQAALRSDLATGLRDALARDEIEILFQPQVNIVTRRIDGVEALARWRHPQFGLLGAATLFAAANDADLVADLSRQIQCRALTAAARWLPRHPDLRLSVNVTAEDVSKQDFLSRFLRDVADSGFGTAGLTVEITESGLIEDLSNAAGLLAALREKGCRVAIDDFGTGYSSLAYLKALPVDYLKIDKGLADDIEGSPRDRVVVRGIIDMARSLGLAVVAEGVESHAQLDLLAEEGCNYYQGFLCSAPLPEDALSDFVAQWNSRVTG